MAAENKAASQATAVKGNIKEGVANAAGGKELEAGGPLFAESTSVDANYELRRRQMRNVWKGFIIGGVTGAAVGLTLELLTGVGEGAVAAADLARERGPEVAGTLTAKAAAGADRARQADVPGKLREAAQTVAASDAAQSLRQGAAAATDAASKAAKSAGSTVADKAKKSRDPS